MLGLGLHPPTRRELLRLGSLGMLGLTLPQLLRAEAIGQQSRTKPRAKSCILFFLLGGQSQLDTFDMKPNAPEGIRGEFRPIATALPGLRVCEHLPRLAKATSDYALIRSMTHEASNHNPGCYYALTGVPPSRDVVALKTSPEDYPHPGAVITKLAPTTQPVPTFVQLSHSLVGDANTQVPGQNAGFLGAQFDPLKVTADPNEDNFGVPELSLPSAVTPQRFERRRNLLKMVEEEFPLIADSPEVQKMDTFYQRAYELVTSPHSRRAFDISREPVGLRDRYGRHRVGQKLILARRLIEAGVRLVTVYWGGPLNNPDDYWDTHKENFPKQKNRLLPAFDQCMTALLDDLKERGLLDETLVLTMGEFGRTPRVGQVSVNAGTDATGRDHWPRCYTAMVAGGGVAGGRVIGRSDKIAAYPEERPTRPEDLIATVYHTLGLDHEAEIHDQLGRPLPLTRGEPVHELFG